MALDFDPMYEYMDDSDSDSSSDDGMSETTVTEQGALSKIGSSFTGMLTGLACFLLAWPVLYCGASRIHWDKVFKSAVPVEQAKSGKAVYITGTPVAYEIGDEPTLAKGKYLKISKSVEAYAYVEDKKSETKERKEGTKTIKETKTTYSYSMNWTSSPKSIGSFNQKFWNRYQRDHRVPKNIENPVITDAEKKPGVVYAPAKIGEYDIDIRDVEFYGGSKELDKVYIKGKEGAPKIGDKRISYSVYPSDIEYTFAGSISGKKFTKYYYKEDEAKLVGGPGTFQALIASLKQSERIKGVLWFLGGFVLMAAGLNMLVGPITTLLEFIPVIGSMGSGIIRFVLGLVALILSAIFWWVVKLWWLILLVILLIVGFLYYRKKSAKPAAA